MNEQEVKLMDEYSNLLNRAYSEMPDNKKRLMEMYPGYKDVIQMPDDYFTSFKVDFSSRGDVKNNNDISKNIFQGYTLTIMRSVIQNGDIFVDDTNGRPELTKELIIKLVDEYCKSKGIHAKISFGISYTSNDVYIPKSQRVKVIYPKPSEVIVGDRQSYALELKRKLERIFEENARLLLNDKLTCSVEIN